MYNSTMQCSTGWFSRSYLGRGTGVAIGTMITLLSHPVEARTGTTGARTIETRCVYNDPFASQLKFSEIEVLPTQRSIIESLSLIRAVFSPTMTELAVTLGVSRQSLYNWVNGEEPGAEYVSRITNLAGAADLFIDEGVSPAGINLKRKIINGKSFLDAVAHGADATHAATILISLIKKENAQREMLNQRLAGRLKRVNDPSELGTSVFDEGV